MDITQAMLDVAYNRGYLAYKTNAYCPYLISIGDNSALKNAWYKGNDAARNDEAPTADDLDAYMAGLSRQNAQEEDAVDILRRLEAKLDQILTKLG